MNGIVSGESWRAMTNGFKVKPGSSVDLSKTDPNGNGGLTRAEGDARYIELARELGELQELMYAAQTLGVLVVFQGLDTSGKDGAIRGVFRDVDPQGCKVASFKVPTPLEIGHDFLWRVHQHTPERGIFSVFNRSHYEDVLVVRVHELVPERVWSKRFDHINAFEKLLSDSNTLVIKFFLNISKEEQEQRLLDREHDIAKAWKLSAADWVERRSWEKYMTAYEDALSKCSTDNAPWYIIPSNSKRYRNMIITETLVELLRPYRQSWLKELEARGEAELKAIKEARAGRTSS